MINSFKSRVRRHEENILFLKQLISNPKLLGAIAPSSKALANFISKSVSSHSEDFVVEIGAGTGRFTKSLLNTGLSTKKLYVIELDPKMCSFLRRNFPNVQVIEGDAANLGNLLPAECHGRVSTIISGIPLVNLSRKKIEQIINSCFSLMNPKGRLLQFTYGLVSPLPAKKLSLKQKRLGYILYNLPPATIWEYQRQGSQRLIY